MALSRPRVAIGGTWLRAVLFAGHSSSLMSLEPDLAPLKNDPGKAVTAEDSKAVLAKRKEILEGFWSPKTKVSWF